MLIINCNKLSSGGDLFPPQKRHGAVGPNDAYTSKTRTEVITVLLRGQTGIALDGLVSTFWKCLNRLLDSLQTRKVLRGVGCPGYHVLTVYIAVFSCGMPRTGWRFRGAGSNAIKGHCT